MPKGDTITVAKMKAEIAAKKARKEASNHNPQVVNEKAVQLQPDHNLEVVHNTEEHKVNLMYKNIVYKELKVNLKDLEVLKILVGTIEVDELETLCRQLTERYRSEGIAVPTSEPLLVDDLIYMSSENILRAHGL